MKLRLQKNEISAKTIYDFKRLEEENYLFLPCKVEEEKETVCMSFDLRRMQGFEKLKEEDRLNQLGALLQAADLEEVYEDYEFSLEPENLYYDVLGRVRVRNRDIIGDESKNRRKNFLRQYQALIGYLLEGAHSYEDYLYGGMELLKMQDKHAVFFEAETVQETRKILLEEYNRLLENEKKYMKKVEIRKYKRLVRYSAASFVLLFCLSLAAFYSFAWYMPRQQKLRAAEDAYLQRDYIAMIDALRGFEIDDLDRAGKYMLATAYIQGQAVDTFSVRDKENILSKVTYHSNENVLDYWLYLGRLEIREAQEIAMKMSDDQLLLYAYMQELRQLEGDEELSGEEKNNRKQELLKEIEELAGKLGI
jgi:Predicted membrane protein